MAITEIKFNKKIPIVLLDKKIDAVFGDYEDIHKVSVDGTVVQISATKGVVSVDFKEESIRVSNGPIAFVDTYDTECKEVIEIAQKIAQKILQTVGRDDKEYTMINYPADKISIDVKKLLSESFSTVLNTLGKSVKATRVVPVEFKIAFNLGDNKVKVMSIMTSSDDFLDKKSAAVAGNRDIVTDFVKLKGEIK